MAYPVNVDGDAVNVNVWGWKTDDPTVHIDDELGLAPRQALKLAIALVDAAYGHLCEKDKADLARVNESWSIGFLGVTLDEEPDDEDQ